MQATYSVNMRLNVKTPMRDGVNLSSDIYLPQADGPFPTVLIRTPYSNNSESLVALGRTLAHLGYACVIQDCRGRWDSEGAFYPVHQEGADGYDTQQWIGQQPWSNGKIGMSGGSYVGFTQWQSAPYCSEFLTCMAPRVTCNNLFSDLYYPGGAFQLGVAMMWGMGIDGRTSQNVDFHNWTDAFRALPLHQKDELVGRDLPYWKDWVGHATDDDYWAAIDVTKKWAEISAPALNIGGWYDLWAQQSFDNFNGLRQHGRSAEARQSRLVMGPWVHALNVGPRIGEIDFGASAMLDLNQLELRWFDYWLKGIDNGVVDEAPLRLFIMGVDQWRDEQEWPLARTEWQKWYLHSGGHANTLRGDGSLSPVAPADEAVDSYVYDPAYPVQTMGGNTCCSPQILPWGPLDQRAVEMRGDVLCYTSDVLEADMEVTGPIRMLLYAATDGADTDWTAKLVDVSPTGYAKNLCDGIVRARYRDSLSQPTLLEPGKVYEYQIEVGVTGNVFRKGHRLRLEVSSSNFPRFDRNLNTGHDASTDTALRTAHQSVHHSRAYPSHLLLPIIPAGSA